jgi:hypothetical protein
MGPHDIGGNAGLGRQPHIRGKSLYQWNDPEGLGYIILGFDDDRVVDKFIFVPSL